MEVFYLKAVLMTRWRFFGCVSIILMMLWCVPFGVIGQTPTIIRIGFSSMVMGDVNENDAMAALKIWAQSFARERGIVAESYPRIFRNVTEIDGALTDKAVDCICLSTMEYVELGTKLAGDTVVVGSTSGSIMESYVLLVHSDSGIQSLENLRGHAIGMVHNARTCLAPVWLDTLLAREALGSAADFFEKILPGSKTAKAVLPVFFRQVDACLVTRNGFEIMRELNPQMGQYLKVLAQSPPLVPVVFCFRSDYASPVRKQIMAELSRWHLNPAGRQILMLFQSDSLEKYPVSCLDTTLELLAEHRRLFREIPIAPAGMSTDYSLKGTP